MTTVVVIYLHDPKVDESTTEAAPSPSSVLLAIAGIVSAYAGQQGDGDAARAWAMGMNHLPFVSPTRQLQQTRTLAGENGAVLASRALAEIVTLIANRNVRVVAHPAALAALSDKIGAALADKLHQDRRAALLTVALTATSDTVGATPILKIDLASRVIADEPLGPPGSVTATELNSSYLVAYGQLATGSRKNEWLTFLSKTKHDDVT
jgi:hypothetical protein